MEILSQARMGATTGPTTTTPPRREAFSDRIRRRLGLARRRRGPKPPSFDPRRRIRKELVDFWVDPPVFCRPGASAVTDLFHFEVVIDGPDGSPYAGGTFLLDVALPRKYPFRPPELTFKTKVYHPNIDSRGAIFLNIFNNDWTPALTLGKLLLSIVSVLIDPMLDRPVNADIAEQYRNRIEHYEKDARACTRKHASTPIVSHYPMKEAEGYSALDPVAVTGGATVPSRRRRCEP